MAKDGRENGTNGTNGGGFCLWFHDDYCNSNLFDPFLYHKNCMLSFNLALLPVTSTWEMAPFAEEFRLLERIGAGATSSALDALDHST